VPGEPVALIAWPLRQRSPLERFAASSDESARIRDFHLSAAEQRRVVAKAERLLAAAGMSPDPGARERASRLVDTVCRLAALLHRLSA
jgi:hypothetical protein